MKVEPAIDKAALVEAVRREYGVRIENFFFVSYNATNGIAISRVSPESSAAKIRQILAGHE